MLSTNKDEEQNFMILNSPLYVTPPQKKQKTLNQLKVTINNGFIEMDDTRKLTTKIYK